MLYDGDGKKNPEIYLFNLTDQMTISGRWVVNAISVGIMK